MPTENRSDGLDGAVRAIRDELERQAVGVEPAGSGCIDKDAVRLHGLVSLDSLARAALTAATTAKVTIPRDAFDFLMGVGPLEGVWFGDLNEGLPGEFWWRGVLRAAAGWPEPAAPKQEG